MGSGETVNDCFHCLRDMSRFTHENQVVHDLFLYPHGVAGCSGVTEDDILRAIRACKFCPKLIIHLGEDEEFDLS